MPTTNTAKGTRDFDGEVLTRRHFLIDQIKSKFQLFGFLPLETPSIENIETLTDKYGEEGDQLLFRILRSGDFLKKLKDKDLNSAAIHELRNAIVDKGLRYDLTIPFARFIARNQQELGLPYKRYQIQTVWRADRPAKGRYREFYQCDADVAGSSSLVSDAEFLILMDQVFSLLNLPATEIKLSNRKVLQAIAEVACLKEKFSEMTVSIDKLDKIGWSGVTAELMKRGISESQAIQLRSLIDRDGDNIEKIEQLKKDFSDNAIGQQGLAELAEVLDLSESYHFNNAEVKIDFTLARGLNYYTGSIYEAVIKNYDMGSIASGGRYDDLTASFGGSTTPGVGMSFGLERIYDVMEALKLFPDLKSNPVKLLFLPLGEDELKHSFQMTNELRAHGVAADVYPTAAKLTKQMKYANKRAVPYTCVIGENELKNQTYPLKNMLSGEVEEVDFNKLKLKLL